jgi:hypothetical protein
MRTLKQKQAGFSIVELLALIVVIAVLGLILWRSLNSKVQESNSGSGASQKFVEWSFDGNVWKAIGTPPVCEAPLAIGAPMDVTKANAVLLPGQVRGGDFKPHGGLSLAETSNNKVAIYAVRDAYLYRGSRYIQNDETQYLLDFMDSCGVMYRFDHLAELTDQFKQYVDQLPKPQQDDSRTHGFREHPLIKKGTIIATEVGIRHDRNAFFDLGVYDLRHRNEASKTDLYKTNSLRIDDKEQSFYATCWFDLLPQQDKNIVKSLPERGDKPWSNSDYCKQ